MNPQRQWLLLGFLALFILIAGLFTWNSIHVARTSLLAGTAPPTDQSIPALPSLPPLRPTDPARGSADQKAVILVEFADFSCLYCRITETEVIKALQSSPKPVRLIWRDLPVANENPQGVLTAIAGRCANDQGKFWQMHDALFQSEQFDIDHLKATAQAAGLNVPTFTQCLSSGKYLSVVQSEIALAQQYHISGTPTFFIGDTYLSGYVTADQLISAIQNAKP